MGVMSHVVRKHVTDVQRQVAPDVPPRGRYLASRRDELDAARAVVDRGDQKRPGVGRALGAARPDLLREVVIEISECLEIALGMTCRDAGGECRRGTEI